MWTLGSSPPLVFASWTPIEKLPVKPCDVYARSTGIASSGLLWGFFPPTEGRGHTWIARMRGLGREEEDLEDTVSHLSIYLTSLDELYCEQAAQLKQQIHRAEKAIQKMEEQRTRAVRVEYSLAALQAQWQEHEARRGVGG